MSVLFTKIQSLSVSNWYCWACRAFATVFFVHKKQSLSVSNWYCWSYRAFGDAQDRVTKGKKKSQKPHSSMKQISL
jgi:cbb3-type cytochrome oxidase subunit 1